MKRRRQFTPLLAGIFALLSGAFALPAGCGGGGGGDDPPVPAASTINGSAYKGRFTSGSVSARAITAAGTPGPVVGSGTVDGAGAFSVPVGAFTGPVLLEVSGGNFDDEVNGPTAQTAALRAVLPAASGDPDLVITPITSMAAAMALHEIALGQAAAAAINQANTRIAGYYKLTGLVTLVPSILSAGPATPGNGANYGALLAGISQQADNLGVAADVLAAALAQDAADGLFNGLASATAIPLGSGTLPVDAGRQSMGTALTTFLGSGANTSALTAGDFVLVQNRLASVPPEIFFVESFTIAPQNLTVAQQMQVRFTANGTFSDGTTGDVTALAAWISGDTNIATFPSTNIAQALTNAGTTTITATIGLVPVQTDLTVGAFTLSSITVTPAAPSLLPAIQQQFTATANYSDATTANISSLVNWQSGNTALLTINATGLASTLTIGSTTVTATESGTAVFGVSMVTIEVSYAANIQPIFTANCAVNGCHIGPSPPLDLRLATYAFVIQGSQNGPVVIPNDPNNSEIIRRLEGTSTPSMPYQLPKLPQSTINLVRAWISMGAPNN